MNLKEYEQEKFGIADIIRSAQAVDTKDDSLQSECRAAASSLSSAPTTREGSSVPNGRAITGAGAGRKSSSPNPTRRSGVITS